MNEKIYIVDQALTELFVAMIPIKYWCGWATAPRTFEIENKLCMYYEEFKALMDGVAL